MPDTPLESRSPTEDKGSVSSIKNESGRPGSRTAPKPAAYCVSLADGSTTGVPRMPGHLYFFRNPQHEGSVPKEQEAARQRIEAFTSVLRIVFQRRHPEHFQDHFNRLLLIAQGVFTPTGFYAEPLNDLDSFKNEIVQAAGGEVKSEYLKRMAIACGVGAGVILFTAILLHFGGRYAADQGWFPHDTLQLKASVIHTGVLLAASMAGLFFAASVRNLTPTFETLATPDADLARPWVRVVLYGIAVLVLALVFQAQIVTVTIGTLFSTAAIADSFLVAVLLGLFLGIAERALPKEVMRRSEEILARVSKKS